MRLLFSYQSERIYSDKEGNYYSSGNFTKEVWERYYSLCDELHVIMRRGNEMICREHYNEKYTKINDDKVHIHLIPDKFLNTKEYLSKKNKIIINNTIEEQVRLCDVAIIRSAEADTIRLCEKYDKPYAVEVVGCVWDSL